MQSIESAAQAIVFYMLAICPQSLHFFVIVGIHTYISQSTLALVIAYRSQCLK